MTVMSRAVFLLVALVLASGPAWAGPLKLEIRNGRVTLEARDVPVRDILAEWARVGRTRIENREQVGGAPVTLTLKDVPEREALDVVLRAVSGYIAAPRSTPEPDTSMYDVIYVLAAARPANPQGTASPQAQSPQLFRGGRGQTVPPAQGVRQSDPTVDENVDLPMPPVRPGAVLEQLQQMQLGVDTIRSGQIQIQMSPGMQMQAAPAGQGGQPLPYTANPGMSTAAPGSATPGMPTGGTTVPGVMPPGAPGTAAKPIKPPGRPN